MSSFSLILTGGILFNYLLLLKFRCFHRSNYNGKTKLLLLWAKQDCQTMTSLAFYFLSSIVKEPVQSIISFSCQGLDMNQMSCFSLVPVKSRLAVSHVPHLVAVCASRVAVHTASFSPPLCHLCDCKTWCYAKICPSVSQIISSSAKQASTLPPHSQGTSDNRNI